MGSKRSKGTRWRLLATAESRRQLTPLALEYNTGDGKNVLGLNYILE